MKLILKFYKYGWKSRRNSSWPNKIIQKSLTFITSTLPISLKNMLDEQSIINIIQYQPLSTCVFSVLYHPVWQNSMHKAPVFQDEGWWLSEVMAHERLFKPWIKLATLYGLPFSFERTNGGQTIVIPTWVFSRLYSPEMNKEHLANNWYFSSDKKKWAFKQKVKFWETFNCHHERES